MNKITKIRLGLENCEGFDFTGESVDYLGIGGIKENVAWQNNSLTKMNTCEYLELVLKPSANLLSNNITKFVEDELPFDRLLKFPDLVNTEIFYDNGESLDVYVNWNGNDENCNSYQTSYIDNDDNLSITVCSDFFREFGSN